MITETKLKDLWSELKNKGEFAVSLSEKVKRSKFTIAKHWFSDSPLSGDMPSDPKLRELIYTELQKAPKKELV